MGNDEDCWCERCARGERHATADIPDGELRLRAIELTEAGVPLPSGLQEFAPKASDGPRDRHPECCAHYCCGGKNGLPCYTDSISRPGGEPRASVRDVLRLHWLTSIDCDHEALTDTARCFCTKWTGTAKASVGEAVTEWIEHVVTHLSNATPENVPVLAAVLAEVARRQGDNDLDEPINEVRHQIFMVAPYVSDRPKLAAESWGTIAAVAIQQLLRLKAGGAT
jgi:hypothetical protein